MSILSALRFAFRSSLAVLALLAVPATLLAAPAFVQQNFATPQVPQALVTATFPGAQSSANFNVVVVGWSDTTSHITSVSDSTGNVYALALNTVQPGIATQSIYFATNIGPRSAGANTVSVQFDAPANYVDLRIAEYSGVATSGALDVVAGAFGNSASADSGSVTTTNANNLLIGASLVQSGTLGPGANYTTRVITVPDSDLLEDRIVTATGSYSASSTLSPAAAWIMQLAAFRASGSGGGDTQAPTAPSALAATVASSSQINLSWTAATDNVAVTSYLIERCTGAGCTTFAQIATAPGTTFNDTGLAASTSYSYRVRATDGAGNASGYSNTGSATTSAAPDTQAPTAPSSLGATAVSTSQINLSWTASTDNVGVSSYLIERCTGASCTTFAQIGTATGTTYNDTGLAASTAYRYRVRATDAASNLSAYSNIASATTNTPPDTQAPTAPGGLGATTVSNTQINLSWTASTDNVGVTSYLIESCAGAGCSNFAQIGTATGTTFNNTGLTASTSYSYRVRATDAASNLSGYSNTATASTSAAPDTQAPTAPSGLGATAASASQINLSWTASTDNVAVTSYLIERCAGAGCSNFAQIGTATGTTFNNTGLAASTSYSYRVRATDAASNLSGYSNTATASTPAAPDTQAPTAPSGLGGTVISSTQINLAWTASTDNVGVTSYLIESCAGASCTNFAQIGTATGTTFNNTGLTASTAYRYRVRATDAAGNLSAYSSIATATTSAAPDTQAPTAPSGLGATATSAVQINLSWTASTDNVGVTSYLIERCTGAGCTGFAQVGTATGTTFSNTGLTASTSYSYRVRATDAAGNLSAYSGTASATTQPPAAAPPAFVQQAYAAPQTPQALVLATYALAQTAGNLNVVVVGWSDTTSHVISVTDSRGNTYVPAVGPTVQAGIATQTIYYAMNIAPSTAGANTVSVQFDAPANYVDLRIAEYSGVATSGAVDVVAAAFGNSGTSDSGSVTTTNASDLLVGASLVQSGTAAPGAGYTMRVITSPDSDLLEDRVVTTTGSYNATSSLTAPAAWIMQLVAFRGAGSTGGGGDTQAPTAPTGLGATTASSTQINLSWTASTDDVGVTSYLIERCAGAGCSNFAQIGNTAATTFNSTGLTASTSYTYRVRASDAAGNLSGYSGTASATTSAPPDTQAPTAPSGLGATVISPSQINLSWTASTDNVGVTSYLIERCTGAGCSNFSQINTTTGTTFSNTGLLGSTSYSYRVRATDAANNLSAYSGTASATTTATPDTQAPTAPSGLGATAVSSTQINLTWTASTDNVGVTSYLIEQCSGAGCTTFAQISTTSTTTFSNAGLTASTSYSYRVRATDAAGNLSAYSGTASATTSAPDTQAPTAPSGLGATAISNTQISLSWTASTDNVAVANYRIERCQGASCTTFAQIGTSTTTTFGDSALTASTTYRYRVRAADAAGNLSGYSGIASATTLSQPSVPLGFVQGNYAVPQTPQSVVNVAFPSVQTAGNLNVVAVGWFNTTANVVSVSDTKGNTYTLAAGPSTHAQAGSQAIFYAAGINGGTGANTITVTFSAAVPYPDVRIAEYQGVDASNPIDSGSEGTGTSATSSSGTFTTTNANDLIVGANYVTTTTITPGTGFVSRMITNPDGSIFEDRIVSTAGSYSATATLASGSWIMQAVAFRGLPPPGPDPIPPTVSVSAPANNATVGGNVTLTANAADTGGSLMGGVQFQVDGLNVGPAVTTAPYSFTLNTAQFANGTHVITAYAWDNAHNVTTATSITVTFMNGAPGNPAQTGLWSGTFPWPLVSIHLNLMADGRILAWDQLATGTPDPRVYDPVTSTFQIVQTNDGQNLFCSGHITLPDGRLFAAGGEVNPVSGQANSHVGLASTHIFNPTSNSWSSGSDMAYGRWYPTLTTMPDGRIFTIGGEINCRDCNATTPEIYNPASNSWAQINQAARDVPWYPYTYVMPDGRLLMAGGAESTSDTAVFNPATNSWSTVDSRILDGGSSAMFLPGKVIKSGTSTDTEHGATPTSTTTYLLDMTVGSPQWQSIAPMAFPRAFHVMTTLPDGTVLVTGGGRTTGYADIPNAVYQAELWSPTTQTWTTMASMNAPRLYHQTATLMPDGRVLVSGSGRGFGRFDVTDQLSAEYYAPPYLFKGPRPVISSAPTQLTTGQVFAVQTPDAARISKVTLVRIGSVTHTFNMDQRYVPLNFTAGSGSLSVTAPANANLAPPGYYMLFLVDTSGVPSVARIVRF